MEGSPSHDDARLREVSQTEHSPSGGEESLDIANRRGALDICQQIERAFLQEVEHAEELAKVIESGMICTLIFIIS